MDNNQVEEKSQNITTTTNNTNTPAIENAEVVQAATIQQQDASQQAEVQSNKVAFNSEEKVLYEIKPEKDANPFGVIVFFVIILTFAFFLPDITKYINKLKPSAPISSTTKEEEPSEEPKEEEITYYNLDETIREAKIGNLELSNFVKSNNNNNYELTFTIINSSEEIFSYNKKYYIDFYNDESYLSSSLIHSFEPLAPKAATEFTITLPSRTYNKATKFALVEKSKDDYPEISLSNVEGEYKLLKCTFNNDEITYYFKDDYLENIYEVYKELPTSITYAANLAKYQSLVVKYNSVEGIESTIIETATDGFTVKNSLILNNIQSTALSDLQEYKYFLYHEKSKVVKYEMTSLGYTCS